MMIQNWPRTSEETEKKKSKYAIAYTIERYDTL